MSKNSQPSSPPEPKDYVRALPFEIVPASDGRTLEGYAAVFDSPAHIRDWAGEYDESFAPGAFQRTLSERTPALLYEHGQHPLIGNLPLGVITQAQEDSSGLHIRATLSDNWLVTPVRDAIRDRAINGMSIRFTTPAGGDTWNQARTQRRVTDANLRELGPVLFPAYQLTTANIRSVLDRLSDLTPPEQMESASENFLVKSQSARRRHLWTTRIRL